MSEHTGAEAGELQLRTGLSEVQDFQRSLNRKLNDLRIDRDRQLARMQLRLPALVPAALAIVAVFMPAVVARPRGVDGELVSMTALGAVHGVPEITGGLALVWVLLVGAALLCAAASASVALSPANRTVGTGDAVGAIVVGSALVVMTATVLVTMPGDVSVSGGLWLFLISGCGTAAAGFRIRRSD